MILVNSNTRQFNIPGSDLVFGVTDDSDVERKHFQCPRYVGDNLDLAACFIRINYRNANGKTDFYLVDDMAIKGDNITFSWLLSPKVTEYRGQVKFVMCAVGPDLKLKWHTAQGTGQVMEGLEPDNSHVESQTADVVAQLIAMVEEQTAAVERVGGEQIVAVKSATETARTTAVNEIEAKRANSLASIPNDYTSLSGAVESLVRGRGGAIICEADGSAVVVDDASNMAIQGMRIFGRSTQDGTPTPDAPAEIKSVENPVVEVHGKNMFPIYPEVTTRGITVTHEPGGWIVLNGTANPDASMFVNVNLPAGTYFFTANNNAGVGETLADSPYIAFRDEGRNWMASNTFAVSNYTRKIEVSKPIKSILLAVPSGLTLNNWRARFQLEIAETGTEFEEYTDQTFTISKNLPGIPVTSGGNYTDKNGQQWICDEVDLDRGVYVKRVHTENITQVASLNNIADWTEEKSQFTGKLSVNGIVGGMCLVTHGVSGIWFKNHPFYAGVGYPSLCVVGGDRVSFGDTVESCNKYLSSLNAVSPIKMTYVMETPTETPLAEAELAAYRTLHSNYPNTTVLNDAGAHMVVKYAADTKLYIDKKIKEALQ